MVRESSSWYRWTMAHRSLVLLLVGSLAGLLVGLACSHHDDPCAGGSCGCVGGDACVLDCAVSPCELDCRDLSTCDLSCGDECEAACEDLSDCALDCGEDCTLSCDRLSNCEAACGARCEYGCRDVSSCDVAVGPDSLVQCARVSGCHVDCHGACRVSCDNVSDCDVRCLDLEGNEVGGPSQEDDGDVVCS